MLLWEVGIALALYVLCCVLTQTEHWFWTTVVIISACVGAQFLHVADLWGFVRHQAGLTALYALGYLVLGVVWSFVKWLSFLLGFRRVRQRERERSAFWQSAYYRGGPLGQTPKAADNKGRIVGWISYWPFSLVGTLFNDPLRSLVQWLFERLSSSYQRVADYVFRDDESGDVKS